MPGPGMDLIGEEEKREVLEVLEAGYLFRYGSTDDPTFKGKVHKLEQAVAQLAGVHYGVAVNSGTTALLVALAGLGDGPGDEVIIPGCAFIASSMSSIIYARAVPILAEVDRTLNLDPADVRRKITERTRAIMVVHMLGNPARLDELKSIATERKLLLLEDCAQAFGARYKGRMVGSIGHAGTYSFNIFKTITAGDGGMVVTDDETAYRRFFNFHDQGHSPMRLGVEVGRRPFVGLDFRMTELTAAVLLAQLRKLDTIKTHLHANKRRFKEAICRVWSSVKSPISRANVPLCSRSSCLVRRWPERWPRSWAPELSPTQAGTVMPTWNSSWISGPSRLRVVLSPVRTTRAVR
jgi:dTDP-4-amino-4,6-dideoxygalactose transaminase